MNKYLKLIISILISEMAGILGSIFTASSIATWYATLQKPSLNPPNWIFGPVWTTLFLLMGISAFLVWERNSRDRKTALVIYSLQLVLNFFWSCIFFGWKNPGLAFVELLVLWIFILLNIFFFFRISKLAGLLLVPYILWVSFAGYLNFSIWKLNYASEKAIKAEIYKAGYCVKNEDCIVLDSKCPFDCMVAINKQEKDRIAKMIDNFQSRCVYGCAVMTGAECNNGRCLLKK